MDENQTFWRRVTFVMPAFRRPNGSFQPEWLAEGALDVSQIARWCRAQSVSMGGPVTMLFTYSDTQIAIAGPPPDWLLEWLPEEERP